MAGFVLIHGSWHGGWCFDPVAEILRARGHAVLAPTLPGMGGTAEELAAVTLAGWADFALEHCRRLRAETGEPVVLAGHSRGGLVVSTAAERDPRAMDALVYICAMMLPDGLSRAEFKKLEGPNPAFDTIISPVHGGVGTVVDPAAAGAVFAQVSPPDLVAAVLPRLIAEPHGPRSEKLALTPERWGSLPRTYVECTQDRTIPIDSQRKMQQFSPGARVVTLDADHSPYLSRPVELADALESSIPA
ncbi:alpha/beta fold hydrolase [Novosphingobium sp. LASN5T]|uniref:alpha/beta fold hydrolase n=1 Tax=Novosphingobium sp. LASN5T TaxID=2491021 RepID=UPI000F603C22|nr:alpha/beta fold hydrolase [Novosphingobium sp. LASN5T]RQW42921.1 alpha/beta hydrolase [Novosphingobium sp. LASN5T]